MYDSVNICMGYYDTVHI